jgi:hypothetical protein
MNDEWTELQDEYQNLLIRGRNITPAEIKRIHQIKDLIEQRWFEVLQDETYRSQK